MQHDLKRKTQVYRNFNRTKGRLNYIVLLCCYCGIVTSGLSKVTRNIEIITSTLLLVFEVYTFNRSRFPDTERHGRVSSLALSQ